MLATSLPSFLNIYSLSTSYLECKTLCIVMKFSFSGPFLEVLLWSTSKMVLSILRGEQFRYLFLWWDFFYVVWFWVVFSFAWDILFLNFFDSVCLMVSAFNNPKYFKFPFLRTFWFLLDKVVLFFPSFVVFHFSLWAWRIFLCQIISLYLPYKFLLHILESIIIIIIIIIIYLHIIVRHVFQTFQSSPGDWIIGCVLNIFIIDSFVDFSWLSV